MYVITGATGHTGTVTSHALLNEGKKVRVVGRSVEKLQPLADKGAEVFIGSLEDESAMTKAFAGATAVYAMIPPNMAAAADFRGYQNRVAKNYINAIKANNVKYVVALSSVGAEQAEGVGPVNGLHDLEQHLNGLDGVNVLALRPGYFMENMFGMIGMIKMMNMIGNSTQPDAKMPMIATRDIGLYAARRLSALDFSGKSHADIYGPNGEVTMTEVTKVLGTTIGKPDLPYVQFSYEDAINGMTMMGLPRPVAEAYAELSRASNEGRLHHTQPKTAENTMLTSLEDFAKIFAAAYNKS